MQLWETQISQQWHCDDKPFGYSSTGEWVYSTSVFLMHILFCLYFHSEFNSQVISICSLWYAVQSYISGWFNTRLWRFLQIFSDSSIIELSIPTYNSNYTVSTGIYRTMYYIYVNHFWSLSLSIILNCCFLTTPSGLAVTHPITNATLVS